MAQRQRERAVGQHRRRHEHERPGELVDVGEREQPPEPLEDVGDERPGLCRHRVREGFARLAPIDEPVREPAFEPARLIRFALHEVVVHIAAVRPPPAGRRLAGHARQQPVGFEQAQVVTEFEVRRGAGNTQQLGDRQVEAVDQR